MAIRSARSLRIAVFATTVMFLFSVCAAAQYVETSTETLVVCPGVIPPHALTPFEFAKSHLVSLWYARNAAETAGEIQKAGKETDNWFSFLTAMMRITKTSTNDFICAKRSILPFAVGQSGENITTAAQFVALVYHAHIDINQRALEVIKKMDSLGQAELSDQLSTLQVERDQRWAALVQPTTMALLSLVDQKRIENNTLPYLVVTKAEKKSLLDWANERFPEFSNGTPRDKWSDPAKTANLYFGLLNGRKCADEK